MAAVRTDADGVPTEADGSAATAEDPHVISAEASTAANATAALNVNLTVLTPL
ncbi:hypothetical protein F750_6481 [Streptomyces sp. PAMC 26508]|nr:hypothetical protein F750_6481 [Streptomyces sp. PAMC 26508]